MTRTRSLTFRLLPFLLGGSLLAACSSPEVTGSEIPTRTDSSPASSTATAGPRDRTHKPFTPVPAGATSVTVLETQPFPAEVYTQGLEVDPTDPQRFLVSRGRNGESGLGTVDAQGHYSPIATLPEEEFGEGLTVVGDKIYQLTWKSGLAHVYSLADGQPTGEQPTYSEEGWGICALNDTTVVTSDGSNTLTIRAAADFAPRHRVAVTRPDGTAVDRLNELECVDGAIYANRWYEDALYRIDLGTGQVTDLWDASALASPQYQDAAALATMDSLNGIAHLEGDRFAVTGKNWPTVFIVELPRQGA